MEVEIDADPNASGGLLVFYSRKLYAGLGFSARNLRLHLYGMDRTSAKPPHLGQRVWIRLRNDRHIVTLDYSADGKKWERYDRAIEVSGYHHNVAYDFLSLRPAALRVAATGKCASAISSTGRCRSALVLAQRRHRIDPRRPPRRQVAGNRRGSRERDRRDDDHRRDRWRRD